MEKGYLDTATGHVRRFFGRRKTGADVNHATFREALADEPQEVTTYVTNTALCATYGLTHLTAPKKTDLKSNLSTKYMMLSLDNSRGYTCILGATQDTRIF